jgi:hypothetical protein
MPAGVLAALVFRVRDAGVQPSRAAAREWFFSRPPPVNGVGLAPNGTGEGRHSFSRVSGE